MKRMKENWTEFKNLGNSRGQFKSAENLWRKGDYFADKTMLMDDG
jgi:hypothetical protein